MHGLELQLLYEFLGYRPRWGTGTVALALEGGRSEWEINGGMGWIWKGMMPIRILGKWGCMPTLCKLVLGTDFHYCCQHH